MPRSLSADANVPIQLESDEGTEQWFYFRALSMEDERKIGNSYDEKISTQDQLQDALLERLVPYLVNWTLTDQDGDDVEFDPDGLKMVIDTTEATELAGKLLASGRLSKDEKKSAESQQLSEAEVSVNTAQQGDAGKSLMECSSSAPTVTVLDASNAEGRGSLS